MKKFYVEKKVWSEFIAGMNAVGIDRVSKKNALGILSIAARQGVELTPEYARGYGERNGLLFKQLLDF